jgi:Right handed beta helix region
MRLVLLCCALCLVEAANIFVTVPATDDADLAQSVGAGDGRVAAASIGCDLYASISNLASQVAAAGPGQTVCLASGSYGTFTGAAKSGMVTIRPAQGARVDMTVVFDGASNITVSGVTLDDATLEGATHDVTLSYSTVASGGQIAIFPDQMTSTSGILIDHNALRNQSCGTDLQGRIDVQDAGANNSNPVGLTISNNYLSGGTADGVRLDAGSGIRVLNNTFTRFDDRDPCHTDTIQIYGSASHIIMKGNFFYNQQNAASCSLGMWDGGDHNVFENNVVAGTPSNGCYGAVGLLDDSSSTVIHNVFAYGGCLPHGLPGDRCGEVTLGGKTGQRAGSGTVIRDNIMTDIANGDGGVNSTYTEDHNLCRPGHVCAATAGDQGPGTGDLVGKPKFVGGSAPTTLAGFALAPGSAGIGRASDGTNMGIELPTGG